MKAVTLKKIAITSLAMIVAATSLSGCGGTGAGVNTKIDGITGPDVEVVNGRVILSMVFNNVAIEGGATIPVPKYPNSSVQVGPDFQSAGTLLTLTVNVDDFLGDRGTKFDPQTLPGGRPLPSVAAGSLPAVAMQIPQLFNAVFYVGPEVIGFFVPFEKIDLAGSMVTFRFYNKQGASVGIVSLVGSDANKKNAGVLALMRADLLGIIKQTASMKASALELSKIYQ
jgi:hypothetical protein